MRLACEDDLAALDDVEPIDKIRNMWDVGFGDADRMTESTDGGEPIDDGRDDHRGKPLSRLVEQQQLRPECERAGNRNHLALAAREGGGAALAILLGAGEKPGSPSQP